MFRMIEETVKLLFQWKASVGTNVVTIMPSLRIKKKGKGLIVQTHDHTRDLSPVFCPYFAEVEEVLA